jgi:hypothetical protein
MNEDALKLICESDFYDLVVTEEQDHKNSRRKIGVKGPFIVCGVKNGNGREYLEDVMVPAVNEYIEEMIDTKRAVGEMNHPPTTQIDYNNACHRITGLTKDGNIWIGESQVLLGTPKGDLLASLLMNDVRVGMSTRGVGKVDKNKVVQKYKMITVDVVHEPSAPGCFMEGILEAKDFMIDNHGFVVEMAYESAKNQLVSLPTRKEERSQEISRILEEFLRSV